MDLTHMLERQSLRLILIHFFFPLKIKSSYCSLISMAKFFLSSKFYTLIFNTTLYQLSLLYQVSSSATTSLLFLRQHIHIIRCHIFIIFQQMSSLCRTLLPPSLQNLTHLYFLSIKFPPKNMFSRALINL